MAAMTHWYFLLLPLVVLAVMSLLRFRGCSFDPPSADPYGDAVKKDHPTAWFRLEDTSGTTAKNEEGPPDGTYKTANSPLGAGESNWHSPAVPSTSLTLAINDPSVILQAKVDPFDFSVRFQGSQVVADVPALQNLTEFTVEALVYADWDTNALGNYYCVAELAGLVPPSLLKAAGFGLYAGPSDTQSTNTPYSWQAWIASARAPRRHRRFRPARARGCRAAAGSGRAGPRASCQPGSKHSRLPKQGHGRRAGLAGPRRGAAPGLRLEASVR